MLPTVGPIDYSLRVVQEISWKSAWTWEDDPPGNTPIMFGIGAVAGRNDVSFVPRYTFSRETLRLRFSRIAWCGQGAGR